MAMRVLVLGDANSSHILKWVDALSVKHEVCLFSLRAYTGSPALRSRIELRLADERLQEGLKSGKPRHLYFRVFCQARRILRAFRPDVVHAFYVPNYGLLAAFLRFHPSIISVLGSDVYSYPTKGVLQRWVVRRVFSRADILLSTSRVMAEEAGQYTRKPFQITSFGVDVHRFQRKPVCRRWGEGSVVFGTVKLLDQHVYGLDLLVAAFAEVAQHHERANPHLVIVGDGPDRERLERLADDFRVADRVHFEGMQPQEALAEYYSQFDVAVFPSRRESFGVSALEAMACECPVICSDAPGFREALAPEVRIMVPIDDYVALCAAMEDMLGNRHLREALGKRGGQYVRAHYSWQHSLEEMGTVYSRLEAKLK